MLQRWKCSSAAETDHLAWNHLLNAVFHAALSKGNERQPLRAARLGTSAWEAPEWHSCPPYYESTFEAATCILPRQSVWPQVCARSRWLREGACFSSLTSVKIIPCFLEALILRCTFIFILVLSGICRELWEELVINCWKICSLQLSNLFWYSLEHRSKSG